MQTKLHHWFIAVVVFSSIHQAAAQFPVITSFSQNGQLVCANLATGTVASVEWASSLTGPWNTNWAGLDAVTVGSNGTITVSVPMFYRVRGVAYIPPTTSDGMALIPAGSFTMGNSIGDSDITDAPPTSVTVSAFYMDTNLVSYSQWQAVYNWAITNGYAFDNGGGDKTTNFPVTAVNWYDTVKWCNARSQLAGLTPVYYTNAALTAVYTNGDVDAVYVNWTGSGYRLPTEAEWEYGARGGLTGQRFPWGNIISETNADYYGDPNGTQYSLDTNYDLGPYGRNAVGLSSGYPTTTPVGYFPPNGYGLYDMAGNVFEWCWDWYGTTYAGGIDPRGPTSGNFRVLRGGNWNYLAWYARCANRFGNNYPPNDDYYGDAGVRCVRAP